MNALQYEHRRHQSPNLLASVLLGFPDRRDEAKYHAEIGQRYRLLDLWLAAIMPLSLLLEYLSSETELPRSWFLAAGATSTITGLFVLGVNLSPGRPSGMLRSSALSVIRLSTWLSCMSRTADLSHLIQNSTVTLVGLIIAAIKVARVLPLIIASATIRLLARYSACIELCCFVGLTMANHKICLSCSEEYQDQFFWLARGMDRTANAVALLNMQSMDSAGMRKGEACFMVVELLMLATVLVCLSVIMQVEIQQRAAFLKKRRQVQQGGLPSNQEMWNAIIQSYGLHAACCLLLPLLSMAWRILTLISPRLF